MERLALEMEVAVIAMQARDLPRESVRLAWESVRLARKYPLARLTSEEIGKLLEAAVQDGGVNARH